MSDWSINILKQKITVTEAFEGKTVLQRTLKIGSPNWVGGDRSKEIALRIVERSLE